jgi:hypothetical protein
MPIDIIVVRGQGSGRADRRSVGVAESRGYYSSCIWPGRLTVQSFRPAMSAHCRQYMFSGILDKISIPDVRPTGWLCRLLHPLSHSREGR